MALSRAKHHRDTPVIGTVLIMALMVTIVGTMLAWGIPQVQDNEAWAQYATTRSNLLNLDADLDCAGSGNHATWQRRRAVLYYTLLHLLPNIRCL